MRIDPHSLRFKITALAATAVALTALGLVVSDYVRTRDFMTEVLQSQLSDSAHAEAVRLEMHFETMARDAQILSATPPIQGIMRSGAASGQVDPLDGTPLMLWENRLATIFTAFLEARPAYTQVRYIGLADNGRELVRVDRKDGAIVRLRGEDLQQKGDEPYMQRVYAAQDGHFFFTPVTLNRELGRVEETRTPTIRLVLPVPDREGGYFGAIVLNANYEALLAQLDPELMPGSTLTVVDANGDYMTFRPGDDSRRLNLHLDEGWRPDPHWEALLGGAPEAELIRTDTRTAIAKSIETDGIWAQKFWVIASARNDARGSGLWLLVSREHRFSLISVALIVIASGVIAARISRHLDKLSRAVKTLSVLDAAMHVRLDTHDGVSEVLGALEGQIVENTARLAASYAAAQVGIVTADGDARIVDMNPAALEIFGYAPGEVTGQSIDILMPEEFRGRHRHYIGAFQKALEPMAKDHELEGLRRDGSRFPVSITLSSIGGGGRKAVVAVVKDISEQRDARREQVRLIGRLEGLAKELARSNEELDRFAYIASHDLKAPLRVIDNASRWLEEDLEEYLDDDTRDSMNLLRNRVRRMEALLDDLLAFSRVGREGYSQQLVSGEVILDHVMGLVALPEGFQLDIGDGFASVFLPLMPVSTVFLNLVGNAIKHHDRSTGTVRIRVEETPSDYVFTVADDGPGIPPQFHDQVFGMFQTLKPRDDVEGSGMGLAFVKKIVELADGSLVLESAGRGASFRFRWPKPPSLQLQIRAA